MDMLNRFDIENNHQCWIRRLKAIFHKAWLVFLYPTEYKSGTQEPLIDIPAVDIPVHYAIKEIAKVLAFSC